MNRHGSFPFASFLVNEGLETCAIIHAVEPS
jgi:hypothetical protein